ncbi:MAG: tRNA (adenosine(37)-N6)-dimethylallyltransferase MiaA [Lachnospiraceae bacterium]|nr:tRNA (adenosine(37)-N6)-dimethylallyltransferase MiaA [Lachnospiraceae bacterium]
MRTDPEKQGAKRRLIVIAGPTAVGKTALSLSLAQRLGGEIVGADSMQVYRRMDIGTAKASKEERALVPHHLIDVAEPDEPFDVTRYQELARAALEEIYARGRVPILAGGTGFYIQAVTRDIDFNSDASDPVFREEMEAYAREHGQAALHAMLRERDPDAADAIPPGNVRRVVRALEFLKTTGRRISEHNVAERARETPYDLTYLVLTRERSALYARIEERVDEMMEEGFLEETRALLESGIPGTAPSMQGLGYGDLQKYLRGECTLEHAVAEIKKNTRRYAKRQLSWFKREPDAVWLDVGTMTPEEVFARAYALCARPQMS